MKKGKRGRLLRYYRDELPLESVVRFITAGGRFQLNQLAIGVRLEPRYEGGKEVFVRKHIFYDREQLMAYLLKQVPNSLEMGMIYPETPPDIRDGPQLLRKYYKNSTDSFIIRKRLMFDWDIDPHKRAAWGKCKCKEKDVCNRCFMAFGMPAAESLKMVLTQWCGFKHVHQVYSGGRGIHTWVCDDAVIDWTPEQRAAFTRRISNILIDEPMYAALHALLKPYFDAGHAHQQMYGIMDLRYDLDMEVSTNIDHLAGIPFFMHRRTGVIRNIVNSKLATKEQAAQFTPK